jgi:hypothetical protein
MKLWGGNLLRISYQVASPWEEMHLNQASLTTISNDRILKPKSLTGLSRLDHSS